MGKIILKTKSEVGMAPDQLTFRGTKKVDSVVIQKISYNEGAFNEDISHDIPSLESISSSDTVDWINIYGLHDVEFLEHVRETLNIDPLLMAEVLNTSARPRLIELDDSISLSMKHLVWNEDRTEIEAHNISFILSNNHLISFQECPNGVFNPVRERLRNNRKRIRKSGSDYLLFALVDTLIDNYIFLISEFGDNVEDLEESLLLESLSGRKLDQIMILKTDINFINRSIKPVRELTGSMLKSDSDVFDEKNEVHYRELLDNISHACESSDSYREILSDLLNIYHTTLSSKINDVIKFLTLFSVVFIPLTFIAGIYGTNFDNIPELHTKYGYYIMIGAMVVVAGIMLLYFRKRKWL